MSEEEIVKAMTNAMPHDILVNTNWTLYKDTKAKDLEIQRLHSIIKEVREYIKNAIETGNCTEDISYENGIKKEHNYYVNSKELLEILDKEK